MQEVFYVFRLMSESGAMSDGRYLYLPILIPQSSDPYAPRYPLSPFESEDQALNYVDSQRDYLGPLVIVKAYNRRSF